MSKISASDLRAAHVSTRLDRIETVDDLVAARRFCPALWAYGDVSNADFMVKLAQYRRTRAFRSARAMHLRNDRMLAARSERLSRVI